MRVLAILFLTIFFNIEVFTQCNTLSIDLGLEQSFCLGQDAVIHAEIDNLSANNFVASYDWIAPNGSLLNYHGSDLHLYNISLAEEGVYTVVAEVAGCPNVLTDQVPLNVLPSFSLEAASIINVCQQEDIALQISVTGTENLPVSYSWSGPNGFVSSLANPTILQAAALDAGVYTVTTTIGNCTLQDALMVQVLSASVIDAQPPFQSVCSGGVVVPLSVSTQNDFTTPTYQWSSGLIPDLSDGQPMMGEMGSSVQPQNAVPGTTYYQVQISYASPGCTDPMAVNFNPNSNVNDGSCLFNVLGCTDPLAINFNSNANQDNGSCSYAIYGCTDPMAENDDALATIDDGSCWYLILGCTDVTAFNYNLNANQDDGTCIPFIYGCTNANASNYSISANTDDGSCIVPGCVDGNADNFDQTATQDDGSCIFLGCMQMGAINFDPNANMEDGSCQFPSYGCTDPSAPNFVVWANINDGSCIYYGCTDWTAFNYDINANTNDGSCIPVITGCIDPNATNYDPTANTDDGSCYLAGCTNPMADNYNGSATVDDGSCLITGCMDPGGVNFQPQANVPGACDYFGCTDPAADNFDPIATINQGCIYSGCTNPSALNYDPQANSDDGSCQVEGCMDPNASNFNPTANIDVPASCEYFGCIDPVAINYNPNALVDDGSCIYIIPGCTDPSAFNYSPSATQDDGSCVPIVMGCTNNQAVNFDPAANTNDGSCQIFGCTNAQASNYNSQANNDDGSCIIPGCMDPAASNFNPQANLDNGTCDYTILGCTDPLAGNYNSNANTDDGSCLPFGCNDPTAYNYLGPAVEDGSCEYLGCMNPIALNYSPIYTINDAASCIFPTPGCMDVNADNYSPSANISDPTACLYLGCTNPNAMNYDPQANQNDGTCIPFIYGCTDPNAFNYDIYANTDDGSCIATVLGCTNSTSFNYNASANVDDGSCVPFTYGCMDPVALNYNPSANVDNGTCIMPYPGCTDPTAFNFNSNANVDDGSCIPIVLGCTNAIALNYNAAANVDDGSCLYNVTGCYQLLSSIYQVDVIADPQILVEPLTSQTICEGGVPLNPIDFQLNTNGLSYTTTWYYSYNGVDVVTASTSGNSFTPNQVFTDLGSHLFWGEISFGSSGCDALQTASSEVLVVADPTLQLVTSPVIDICASGVSSPIEMSVTGGVEPGVFEWYQSATSISSGNLIPGQQQSIYLPDASLVGNQYYYAVYSQSTSGCEAVSPVTTFNVVPQPTITSNPISLQEICQGGQLQTLVTDFTGGVGNAGVQWYISTSPSIASGSSIIGANTNAYDPLSQPVGSSYYFCEISFPLESGCQNQVSNPAAVSIYTDPALVSSATVTETICTGGEVYADFQLNYFGGIGTPTYQWYQSSAVGQPATAILGASGATYTPGIFGSEGSFTFYGTVSFDISGCDALTSPSQEVVVLPDPVLSSVATIQQTQCQGSDVQTPMGVTVTGYQGTPQFQWWENNTNSNIGGTMLSGETLSEYIAPTGTLGTQYYYCEVTNVGLNGNMNTGCSSVSPVFAIEVVSPALVTGVNLIQEQCTGATPFVLSNAYTGGYGQASVQWYSNTTPTSLGGTPIGGATSEDYVPSTTTEGTTYYYMELTQQGGGCPVVSGPVHEVEVHGYPTYTIDYTPVLCFGETTDLVLNFSPAGTYQFTLTGPNGLQTYNNYVSGSAIGLSPTQDAYYQLEQIASVQSPQCAVDAPGLVGITVHALPVVSGTQTSYCDGTLNGVLGVSLPGPTGQYTVAWQTDVTLGFAPTNPAQTQQTVALQSGVNASQTQTYSVEVTENSTGCTSTAQSTLTVHPNPTAMFTAPSEVCVNSSVALTNNSVSNTTNAWYWDGQLVSNVVQPNNINEAIAGMHTLALVVNNSWGCTSTAQQNIETIAYPSFTSVSTPQQTQCQGSDVQTPMGVAVTGYQGTPQYQWWESTTNSNIGGTVLTGETLSEYIAPTGTLGTQYYYCEVTNVGLNGNMNTGCSSVSPVFAIEVVSPAVVTGVNLIQEQCTGATPLVLSNAYTGGYGQASVQWYSNTTPTSLGGVPIGGATSEDYLPSNTTEGTTYYYMELTQQGGGCPVVSGPVHEVEVHGYPVFTIDYEPSICLGETTDLVLNFSSGGNYQFNLTGPNGLQTYNNYTSGTAIALSPTQDAYYQLEQIANVQSSQCAVDAPGLLGIDVNPLPVITGTQASYCDGTLNGALGVSLPGPTGQYTVAWQTDVTLGFVPTNPAQSQQTVVLQSGVNASETRTYSVAVTQNNTGCTSTAQSSVTVHPNPTAMFTAPGEVCVNSSVALTNNSISNTTNAWYWDGQLVSNVSQPNNINEAIAGMHTLALVVQNVLGCVNEYVQNVEVVDFPVAQFASNVVSGCSPLWVQFDNQSVAAASDYTWYLGPDTLSWGSSTSTLDEIGSVYFIGNVVPSEYAISLTATNVCGSDNFERLITAYTKPNAIFQANLDSLAGCSPFELSFNNLSEGIVSQYLWSYGDGQSSTAFEDVEHIFYSGQQDAFYPVALTASNLCGSSTMIDTVVVLSQEVEAFFTLPYNVGCAPLEVCFDDNSDGYGINSHSFFSGDGQMYSASSGCHVYQNPGTYQLIEQISNGCQTDQSTVEITVLPHPEVQLSVNTDEACTNELIVPAATADVPVNYLWTIDQFDSLTVTYPSIVFDTPGLHWVTITATGVNNCSIKDSLSVLIHDIPQSSFNIPVNSVCSPFNVCFNLTGSGDYFFWDFSDGNTATAANPCHVFTNLTMVPQEFPVQLISENTFGCKDTMIQEVVVLPQPDIQLSLPYNQTCLQEVLIDPVLQPSSALGFDWLLDGVLVSNLVAPSILVQGVGPHTIGVNASNQYGCTGTDVETLEISPIPVADFIVNTGSGCVPLNVSATNLSTGGDSYTWQVGDVLLSTFDLNLDIETAVDFNISLITENTAGCSDTAYAVDSYSAYPVPYVEIKYSPEEIYDYQGAIQFNDIGSGASMWYWEMGDGSQEYSNELYHSYDFVGEYLVSLEGTNEFGCIARDSAMVNIKRDFEIFVPNAFTPKSYDGVNDYFKPTIRGKELVLNYKFSITDRWGDLIFETNDMDAAWNGSMDNSPDYFVQNDTYIWMVSVELLTESTSKSLSGTVTIIR